MEALKLKKREAKKRKRSLEGVLKDAEKKTIAFEQKVHLIKKFIFIYIQFKIS